jgi:ribosomal 50S subunit-associated protein YjgA (DUF615 family)
MGTQPDRVFEDLRNTVNEYARIVRGRWRLGLIGVGIVGSLAFWGSQYLPRQYRATTLFERRDDVVLRNLIQRNSPYSFDTLKSSIAMDMTGSRALATAGVELGMLPVEEFSAVGPLSDRQLKMLDGVRGRYKLGATIRLIHSSPSLDTIELCCEANDPQVARQFVIALRDRYVRHTRERISEILSSTKEFFELEVERHRRRAVAVHQELRQRFEEFPGIDPLDPGSAGGRVESLRLERDRLAQRQAELQAQIAAREQFLVSAPVMEADEVVATSASQPPVLPGTEETIRCRIAEVEGQITEAMTVNRMTAEHPAVKALYRKLDGLREAQRAIRVSAEAAQATEEAPADAGPPRAKVHPQWYAQRLRVELELDALRKQLDVVRPRCEDAVARAQRIEQLYDELMQKGEELHGLEDKYTQDTATAVAWHQYLGQLNRILAAESEQRGTQFTLLEDPKQINHATSPRVGSVFAVCSGIGLAAAVLLVALAELLDRTFRSPGQVTRVLGVPVLECVRVIPTPRERRRRWIARLTWTPALGILLACLLVTASLAYSSLERPALHQRAITKLDHALGKLGVPPTSLAKEHSG